jgi:hypothetical protein
MGWGTSRGIRARAAVLSLWLGCTGIGACEAGVTVSNDQQPCPLGQVRCADRCVDPLTNNFHCGAGANCAADPGEECEPGHVCDGTGNCAVSCQNKLNVAACDGVCTDTSIHPEHCGGCGNACTAGVGEVFDCVDGTCVTWCVCSIAGVAECAPAELCGPHKKVFVSSAVYTGDMGGLAGADEKCNSLAAAAGLTGTYKAWLSDATESPSTRFAKAAVPYLLVDGTLIAKNWDALTNDDKPLESAIDRTEWGESPPDGDKPSCAGRPVLTVTSRTGRYRYADMSPAPEPCDNWTSSSSATLSLLSWGNWSGTGSAWTRICSSTAPTNGCEYANPIYCFEQ